MRTFLPALIIVAFCGPALETLGQSDPVSREWNRPVQPFRIIGNLYYVGATDVTSYLIASSEGLILLDSGFRETVPQILENIRALGFDPHDVRILLNSHAHYDHAGGLAALKRWTGARVFASRADAAQLEDGAQHDFFFGDRFSFEPVAVDRVLADGDRVVLGDATLVAHLTPGHTKGCTSWTMDILENGVRYGVLFVCSTTVPGYLLVNNSNYPDIAKDYRRSFRKLRRLKCDVFLASHGSFFDLQGKMKAMWDSVPQPFIDPTGCQTFLRESEQEFEETLKAQRRGQAFQ